jgi:hypothetical protein
MIQIVSHTAFWDMPWYEKLSHLVFSYNPHGWKSIRIIDGVIEYYSGYEDPTNEIVTWVFIKGIPEEWFYKWIPKINNKITHKEFFDSNHDYEDIAVFIDDKIVYDKRYDDVSWISTSNDEKWIIEQMMALLKYYESGHINYGLFGPHYEPYYYRYIKNWRYY